MTTKVIRIHYYIEDVLMGDFDKIDKNKKADTSISFHWGFDKETGAFLYSVKSTNIVDLEKHESDLLRVFGKNKVYIVVDDLSQFYSDKFYPLFTKLERMLKTTIFAINKQDIQLKRIIREDESQLKSWLTKLFSCKDDKISMWDNFLSDKKMLNNKNSISLTEQEIKNIYALRIKIAHAKKIRQTDFENKNFNTISKVKTIMTIIANNINSAIEPYDFNEFGKILKETVKTILAGFTEVYKDISSLFIK